MSTPSRHIVSGFECALCESTRASRWRTQDGWTVVRCVRCELLATWPRPDAAAAARLYHSTDYFDARSVEAGDAWLARARDIFGVLPSDGGPVLDFGAGPGYLVNAARTLGIAMDGVEPSKGARDRARQLYGIELQPHLEAAEGPRYAALTMLHVLEHLDDPVGQLRAIGTRLAPGALAWIEVPHAGSADIWVPAWRRRILDLPAHLHHFTPETLARVLRAGGFEIEEVRLSNATVVERLLERRTARATDANADDYRSLVTDSPGEAVTAGWQEDRRAALRRSWRSLLEGLRGAFPGGKLQVIASRER